MRTNMKTTLAPLLLLVSVILQFGNSVIASSAVPLRWTVETSAANPATFDQFAGASYDLEAALQSCGKPLAVEGDAHLYWQTNGMGSAWWTAPATVSGNVLRATWTPSCDVGAKVYNCFIGITGTTYNAAFQLRLRPSPGAVPNIIEQPPRVLDLARTVVVNPPWPTDATIDASIRRVIDEDGITAPVSTNTVKGIISNTVDKAYVESLGISGSGSGGTNTNDVKAIVDAEVGGTNSLKDAVAAIDAKRGMTDLDVYELYGTYGGLTDLPDQELIEFSKVNPYISGYKTQYEKRTVSVIDFGIGIAFDGNGHAITYQFQGGDISFFSTYSANDGDTILNAYWQDWFSIPELKFHGITVPNGDKLATSNGVENALAEKADIVDVDEAKDIASAARETANDALAEANDANVWSMATYNFMTGGRTNCWFSGTNYVFGADAATRTRFAWEDGMDAATVPCSMALWEIRDGTRQLVWDQKDWPTWYWSFKAHKMQTNVTAQIAALGMAVTNDANYAWAKRYASDGTPNPDASTTFIDTPSVTLSPGMKWETIATVSGAAYWTIVGNGAVIGGSGTNATLRIMDFEGNDIITVTKGEHSLKWLEASDFAGNMVDENGWVCFDIFADENADPVGYFSTTLYSSDFLPQTDQNSPAQYSWENLHNGKWRIHYLLKPGIQANCCFLKIQVETEGQTVIRYNAGQEISGGLIYNGVNIAPDVSGSPAVGTVIQWKVVR